MICMVQVYRVYTSVFNFTAFLLYVVLLCVSFIIIIIVYYARRQHTKYRKQNTPIQ